MTPTEAALREALEGQTNRNVQLAARDLATADDERLKLIALRDPDMIRDVARATIRPIWTRCADDCSMNDNECGPCSCGAYEAAVREAYAARQALALPPQAPAAGVVETEWLRDGNLLYTLEQTGWRKGEPVLENRLMIRVDRGRHASQEEVEALTSRLLAALALKAGEPGWRPIDSAPKDGTIVDLCRHGDRWPDCFWGKPDHECGEAGRYCDDDWHGAKPGWVEATFQQFAPQNPTHWMPLPAAPSPPSGGGGE